MRKISGMKLINQLIIVAAMPLTGMLLLLITFYISNQNLINKTILPSVEEHIYHENEGKLKSLVEAELSLINDKIKNLSPEKKVSVMRNVTNPVRFFDDKSGYFFIYDYSGNRVSYPVNPETNGKNYIDLKDTNGVTIIADLAKAAKNGGGFVKYHFEKPGSGLQPKLSYAMPIDGTDMFIGTGAYIDNIQKDVNMIASSIHKDSSKSLTFIIFLFVILIVTVMIIVYYISKIIQKNYTLTLEFADTMIKGELDSEKTFESSNEIGLIIDSMANVKKTVKGLILELDNVAKAAAKGDFTVKGNASRFQGGYSDLIKGVNTLVENVETPINETVSVIEQFAVNNFSARMKGSYEGSFQVLADSLDALSMNMSELISISKNIADGHLGDLVKLERTGKLSREDEMIPAYIEMMRAIQGLIHDTKILVDSAIAGDLKTRADAERHKGAFKQVINGVNNIVDTITIPLNVSVNALNDIAGGKLPDKVTAEFKGDYNAIKNAVNNYIDVMNLLLDNIEKIIDATKNGDLKFRASRNTLIKGSWESVLTGINGICDAYKTPLDEILEVMENLSKGDLTTEMQNSYKGDFDKIKQAANASIASLEDVLSQVNIATQEVSNGSQQVAVASQNLSEGASVQASSLEEISSSMQQIASQIKANAENSQAANSIAKQAMNAADKGNIEMANLLSAMKEIQDSSNEISKIIKVIDEIAFQTNLLALNAAVEAARAGIHGKGFAVVAEEVRNLAARSAKAAKETGQMIENAVQKSSAGSSMSKQTAEILEKIVGDVAKVTDIVGEIAAASNEQAQGVSQINIGLSQVDQVTQENTASAEESAAASEELSGQADNLKSMMKRFRLKSNFGRLENHSKKNYSKKDEDMFLLD